MAQPQNLETALKNLQKLPNRIAQLQETGARFRQVLGDKLTKITTRLQEVKRRVSQQGNAKKELEKLRTQIREQAPTAAQLTTLTNIMTQIDPGRLEQELTALDREVSALEQAVGINARNNQGGPPRGQGPGGQGPGGQGPGGQGPGGQGPGGQGPGGAPSMRGGYLHSPVANKSRVLRSKHRKQNKTFKKHHKHHKKHKKHKKHKTKKVNKGKRKYKKKK
jgi:hypothetical protein